MNRNDETINLKLLAGEPVDGSGRLCIHFLVQDDVGKIETPGTLTPALKENPFAPVVLELKGPRKWRIACRPEQNSVQPQVRNGVRYVCLYSNDPLAVTCPGCLESADMTQGVVGEFLAKVAKDGPPDVMEEIVKKKALASVPA